MEKKKAEIGLLESSYQNDKKEWRLWLGLSFLCFPLATVIVYSNRKYMNGMYSKVKKMKENDERRNLIEMLKKNTKHIGVKFDITYPAYALFDMGYYEVIQLLKEIIVVFSKEITYSSGKNEDIATKRISRINPVLSKLEYNYSEVQRNNQSIEDNETTIEDLREDTLPVTSTVLMAKEPENEKCMITKLQLDFENHDVVICPKCRNFAIKIELEKWFKEKNICPICESPIKIDQWPLVIIRD